MTQSFFERDPLEPLRLTRLIDFPDHDVLTAGMIAEALRISLRAAYRLLESGKIPSKRDGRCRAAWARDVKRYVLRTYGGESLKIP